MRVIDRAIKAQKTDELPWAFGRRVYKAAGFPIIVGPTGPTGPKGDRGVCGPTGPIGSSIISFFPFGTHGSGFNSTTFSDGSPARVGIMSFGETASVSVSDALPGTITMPGCEQNGFTMPVNCVLDTICLSVGNPEFHPAHDQTVYVFAMLATADGDSQLFTLRPEAKAEFKFVPEETYPAQVQTIRVTGLGIMLKAETRCMIVCGHYTTGEIGSSSYKLTYSGSLLFK